MKLPEVQKSIERVEKLLPAATCEEIDKAITIVQQIKENALMALICHEVSRKIADASNKSLKIPEKEPLDDHEVFLPHIVKSLLHEIQENLTSSPGLVPHGILLAGPAGTGKSVIAHHIAAKVGVPILQLAIPTTGDPNSASKLESMFAAIKSHKPCIVIIEDIDQYKPLSIDWRSADSNELAFKRTFHSSIADDHLMQEVLFIATTRYPERIDSHLITSHRFSEVYAILPPKTLTEQVNLFRAIWYQTEPVNLPEIDDQKLEALFKDFPAHITGSDFKKIIIDAKRLASKKTEKTDIMNILYDMKESIINDKYLRKLDDFDHMIRSAIDADNTSWKVEE